MFIRGRLAKVVALDATRPRQFLADEWHSKKSATLRLHSNIKKFLKMKFDLDFETFQAEKEAAIKALQFSGTFAAAHSAIAELVPYAEYFEQDDLAAMGRAALENSQVRWIAEDADVGSFYRKLLEKILSSGLAPGEVTKLKELYPEPATDDDDPV